ncbi:MAG: hypothetical protein IKK57_01565 [Clostridia bacterium]|nr:hypothetical protein [Clostridia bacterium]
MPESLYDFHARVDEFQQDSLPHAGDLVTRASLTDKVAPDGSLRPFHGSTVIYGLTDAEKLALAHRQTLLHHLCAPCLAEPLEPASFHLTLHDLISGTNLPDVSARVARTIRQAEDLLQAIRQENTPPVQVVSTHAFSMVNTSVVMGFAPQTEADCERLMVLYERFHAVVPLQWGLTPHVTLAYYRPGCYGQETLHALQEAIRRMEDLPPLQLTLHPERLFCRRFSDMNHYF